MQRRFRGCLGLLLGMLVAGCTDSTLVRKDLPDGERLAPVNLYVTVPRSVTVGESAPYRYLASKIQRDHPFAGVAYEHERWPLTLELVYRSGPKTSVLEVVKMLAGAATLFLVPIPQTRVYRLQVNVYTVSASGRAPRGEVKYEVEGTKLMWLPLAFANTETEGVDRLLAQLYNDLRVHHVVPTIDELRKQQTPVT